MTWALLLVLLLVAPVRAQWSHGADEGPVTAATTTLPPAPSPTTSTSTTTSTTLPATTVSCGNPTTGDPPSLIGWWAGARSASQGCVAGQTSTVVGIRLYLGSLGAPFGLRVALYRQNPGGSLTRLCQSPRITSATPNAWRMIPLTGCGTIAAGTPLLPAWILEAQDTDLGEWTTLTPGGDCGAAYGSAGTNRWALGGTPSDPFPSPWNPASPDGCRSAVGVLLQPATSSTATTSSSTTTSTVICCHPSTEPCV